LFGTVEGALKRTEALGMPLKAKRLWCRFAFS